MDAGRHHHVRDALRLLAQLEPSAYVHICREVREVVFGPTWCPPNSIACTGGPLGRQVVLDRDPLSMDLPELAALIFHEALHLASDEHGNLVTVPHDCTDCTNLAERARDFIYRAEAELEARLRSATGIYKRKTTFPWGELLASVFVGACIGLALGAATSGAPRRR